MVILTGKVSKGTLMDQIYIPKERPVGFELGAVVVIKPLAGKEANPVYYNIAGLEPIKVTVMQKIFQELSEIDNFVITGSFLEKGFKFSDIDIILIDDRDLDAKKIGQRLSKALDLKFHVIKLSYSSLIKGLETDPLYQSMLSKCISKKRLIFKVKNKVNYRLLDLHLLKSKPLMGNFDFLAGNQKYEMARNLIAIYLFLNGKKVSIETIDLNIKKLLKEDASDIKQNFVNKSVFLKEYKKLYGKLFNKILNPVANAVLSELNVN